MSEAARNDLYNGLSELLGPERAETLMSYLPRYEQEAVATRADISSLKSEIVGLRSELKGDVGSLRSELRDDIASLRSDLGSLQRTLIGGFVTFGVAMIGLFVAVL